ncbi:hypothetical protein Pmani_008945 [Petrolisthes manimaculis]|uniref:Reverse transcriptase domain-containing protein n=1 Tax=Petrolisthes manimaculis TaxID=1843537 RepID=A0AAE1Q7F1_9EUCA|nr:hypothetical protein Pmani_008945 [Petrolisthes manimaculis]
MLTLGEAVQLARSLDVAQRNAEVYMTPVTTGYTSAVAELSSDPSTGKYLNNEAASDSWVGITEGTVTSAAVSKLACYFCGRGRHLRYRCPAREWPICTQTREFSKLDEQFIREEVKSLLQDGVIEMSQSPWRAQVLVTNDERHKRRMVVDYSRTINRFTLLDAYPIPHINKLVHSLAKYRIFTKLDLKSAYYQVPLRDDEKLYTAFEADGQLFQYTRIPFGLTNAVAAFQRLINTIISDSNLGDTFAYIDDVIICGFGQEDHDKNLENFRDVASKYNLTLNESKCQYSMTEISYLGYCISDGTIRPDPERLKPLLDMPCPTDLVSLKRTLGLLSYYSQWIPNYSSRILPLLSSKSFPLDCLSVQCFESLKKEICKASVAALDEDLAPSPRDRVPSIEAHTPIPSSTTYKTPILQPGTDDSLMDSLVSSPGDSATPPSPDVEVRIQPTPGRRSTGPDVEDPSRTDVLRRSTRIKKPIDRLEIL